jgi:hypothetical protein
MKAFDYIVVGKCFHEHPSFITHSEFQAVEYALEWST